MSMSQPLSIPGVTDSSIDGELLWGFWYPALRGDELRGARARDLDAHGSSPRARAGLRRKKRLRCATFARTARFRSRRDRATGRPSSALITAGALTRIRASAAKSPRLRQIRSCSAIVSTRGVFPARSATATFGCIWRMPKAAPWIARRSRPRRSCRNSASAIASPILPPTLPAAWTRASSA